MRYVTFDTETVSLEKPFCYNIGYKITDSETKETLITRDFVVEQVWHNDALFSTAYYAEKRQLYVNSMRAKKTIMMKYGFIMRAIIKDFEFFQVSEAYAFNSTFDERVFNFNCEWFKCNNPFDNIPIYDIRGYVHNKIAFTSEYQEFCEKHKLFTETENYSTTAESVFKFISQNEDFEEEHTALADSDIEQEVLEYCISKGCKYGQNYKTYRTIPNNKLRFLTIVEKASGKETQFVYKKKLERGEKIFLS